jgi:hypothetical protein
VKKSEIALVTYKVRKDLLLMKRLSASCGDSLWRLWRTLQLQLVASHLTVRQRGKHSGVGNPLSARNIWLKAQR